MKQLPLFKVKNNILAELKPCTLQTMELFDDKLYSKIPGDVLYNHCYHVFHSYYQGVKKGWYIDKDEFVAVGQKFTTAPQYYISAPMCSTAYLIHIIKELGKHGPVKVVDLNAEQVKGIVGTNSDAWDVKKEPGDVIFDLKKCIEMKGNNYKGIRNGINRFKKDNPNYCVKELTSNKVAEDAVKVIDEWRETQGLKYFRVTVGRDKEIFRIFWPVVDNINTFGIVVYDGDGKPVGASLACRSKANPEYGMELTTKVLVDDKYRGLTDFTSDIIFRKMHNVGILYSNEAGIYGKGTKFNKEKWHPIGNFTNYSLVYKGD